MSDVRMRHPELDAEQVITVAESAVPFHRAAGWEVVEDEPEADGNKGNADDGESSGEQRKTERPRASAAKKKEQ